MSASITFDIHFASGKSSHRVIRKGKRPKHAKPTRLPRITRLMALSIKYEHLIHKGLVNGHGELADLAGVDRSHISAILRYRLLAPDIQEWLVNLPETEKGDDPLGFMELRHLASIASWEEQRKELDRLLSPKGISPPQADGLACGIGTTNGLENKEK